MRSGIYTILFFLSFLPVALLAAWYVIGQQRLDKKRKREIDGKGKQWKSVDDQPLDNT